MRYIFLLFAFLLPAFVLAQTSKPFEGEITFKLDIQGGGEEMTLARQFMPAGFQYLLKGNNVLIKSLGENASMAGNVVFNAKSKQAFLVQDAARTVYLIQETSKKDESTDDVNQTPRVRTGNDPRTIAGYSCKHFIITNPEDESGETELWVAESILVNMPEALGSNMPIDQKIMSVVKGFPLGLKMDGPDGLKISMTATEIIKKPMSNNIFDIPEGYEVKKLEHGNTTTGGGQ